MLSDQPQRSLRNHPPLRASQVTPAPTVVTAAPDASKAASGNAPCVKAAFGEAGLSQDAINHILTRYPHYLRWDVEQKLLPARRRWQQELRERLPSEFNRIPTLLHLIPEEETEKDSYLMSIGVTSTRRLRQKLSATFKKSLITLQGRVAFLRARGFTQAQVTSLIQQHPDI